MTDAVIVSTARTPIGRAYRGAFNRTTGPALGAHVIAHAVRRAGIDPAEIEEVILGVGRPEGTTGGNVARQSAIRAGLPVGSTGSVISRACGSGLNAIAAAAHRVIVDRVPVVVAGVMYIPANNRVLALDAATGAEIWVHELPAQTDQGPGTGGGGGFSGRGVGYWPGQRGMAPRILVMRSNMLVALDAAAVRSVGERM